VKEIVAKLKLRSAEVFMPLVHAPGEAQVDFGFADLVIDMERWKGAIFVMALPFSNAIFVRVFPRECPEAFYAGHVLAFRYFGGVPHRISYDNTSSAISKLLGRRARELTTDFTRLKSRYLFASHFCLVRRPNEKGVVENVVGFGRRNFLVPVPNKPDFATLNARLERECRADLNLNLPRFRGQETMCGPPGSKNAVRVR
jgi:transposase